MGLPASSEEGQTGPGLLGKMYELHIQYKKSKKVKKTFDKKIGLCYYIEVDSESR